MEASSFSRFLAKSMCESLYMALHEESIRREQALEDARLETGKYDRAQLEHIENYQGNAELDEWLEALLIDASLDKRDQAAFKCLTAQPLEGW